jgi:Uma2 family endonuclease
MARKPGPRATYADIEALPENLVGELIDGELIVSPRPRPRHGRVAIVLGHFLGPFDFGDDGPGGWWILAEPELHLHGDVLVPDLAAWRRERVTEIPDTVGITIAPDWICEILSPSTEQIDRTRKMQVYAREGVEWAWIIDPSEHALEVFHREDGVLGQVDRFDEGGTARIRARPFDAIELQPSRWWLPQKGAQP